MSPVDVDDVYMAARLAKMRSYPLVLLNKGPQYQPPATRSPEQAAIVREHGRRNMQLQVDGSIALVGPLSGAGDLVGIAVFTVAEAEVRRIMDGDGAVLAGIFTYEIAVWYGFPGDSLP